MLTSLSVRIAYTAHLLTYICLGPRARWSQVDCLLLETSFAIYRYQSIDGPKKPLE